MAQTKSLGSAIRNILSNNWTFWVFLAVFVIEASWIAIASLYPMAFDEEFHFGLIKLYAAHLSPFWSEQPAHASQFSAVVTDPSYFYQWLMSFPYRLLHSLISNETIVIVILRLMNVALFASGIWLWRVFFNRVGVTKAITHTALILFMLIPVASLLAAHINYDNLLFPLVAAVFILVHSYIQRLSKKRLPVTLLLLIIATSLMASIVKYPYLPILFVTVCYLVWITIYRIRSPKTMWKLVCEDIKTTRRTPLIIAAIFAVLFIGLFTQRDIVNTIRYHTPAPDCAQVLSVEECSAFGPWLRDYNLKNNKTQTDYNVYHFARAWADGMWTRSLFALAGPTNDYQTRKPYPVPGYTVIFAVIIGVLAVLLRGASIFRRSPHALKLAILASVFYVIVLFADGYEAFVRTSQPVAINGRYLLLVLLPLMVWAGMSLSAVLKKHVTVKASIAIVLIIGMIYGGGGLTYVLRSEPAWYWSYTPFWTVTNQMQQTLRPLVIDNK